MNVFDDENADFEVVINGEEQYSIWPADRPVPEGWRAVGQHGKRAECLAYVERAWTDMRPLSLRRQIEETERNRAD